MTQPARLFFRQFLQAPRSVGAILPSSPALAEAMLAPIAFSAVRVLVEFGPGSGAFTRAIAPRLGSRIRYLGIELNDAFCRTLAQDFPRLEFVHGSVAELGPILAARGIAQTEAIVCGLPWASLPLGLQDRVFHQIDRVLAPGGVFVTFAYLHGLALPGAWALRRQLRRHFAQVRQSPVIWANVPPAFVYICRKSANRA